MMVACYDERMKTITLRLSDEAHMNVKLNATRAGMTMQDFILNGRLDNKLHVKEASKKDVKPVIMHEAEYPVTKTAVGIKKQATFGEARKPLPKKQPKEKQ